ncbi:unnamed protein product, partial [Dicrocoelium dendriticum]
LLMRPRCTNRQLPARDRYLRAKTCLGQIDQRDCPVEVTENEILTPKKCEPLPHTEKTGRLCTNNIQ